MERIGPADDDGFEFVWMNEALAVLGTAAESGYLLLEIEEHRLADSAKKLDSPPVALTA